jgi:Holliday junction resolvase
MKGGKAARQKGNRFEASAVNELREAGVECQRIPLSGSAGGDFSGDITATIQGQKWTVEAKCRAAGFKMLYAWLGSHKALFLKRDRSEPLVLMRLSDFAALANPKAPE